MSAEEFVRWQAYLRHHARGFSWERWAHAALLQMIDSTKPRKHGDRLPNIDAYQWKAPVPLYVERLKREARGKRKLKESRDE